MAGSDNDPATMTVAEKLDFLVNQVTSLTDLGTKMSAQMETLNRCMDSHDMRLARLETTRQQGSNRSFPLRARVWVD